LFHGLDLNTRIIVFATNLTLAEGETSSAVVVNLVDSNGEAHNIFAEDVKAVPTFNFAQVIFRLPDSLHVGVCTIRITAHGQTTNAGTFRIRI